MQNDLTSTAGSSFEPSFRLGRRRDVLSGILEPHVNVALWQREVPARVRATLDGWARSKDRDFEATLDASGYDLSRALQGIDDERTRMYLLSDIPVLLGLLLGLSGAKRLRVSFGPVRGDQCRKFHCDYVKLRLVTTYTGPGTEWLADDAVDRDAMDLSGGCVDEANARIVKSPDEVRRANAGDVVLLKGAKYRGSSERTAAVHRSPPIESTGAVRVVLIATVL